MSVIIPTHRDRGYITETLASVLRNIEPQDEVLIVANGSDAAYISKLKQMAVFPIRLIENTTPCVSTARNAGMHEAEGEFLQFLDDDDLLQDGGLASLRTALAANDAWLAAVGDVECFGEPADEDWIRHPHGHGQYDSVQILRHCIRSPGAGLVRRSAMIECDGFDSRYVPTEDYDAWLRLSLSGPIVWIPAHTLRYRVHREAVSRQESRMALGTLRVIRRHIAAVRQRAGARHCFWALLNVYNWYNPRLRAICVSALRRREMRTLAQIARTYLLFGSVMTVLAAFATLERYTQHAKAVLPRAS